MIEYHFSDLLRDILGIHRDFSDCTLNCQWIDHNNIYSIPSVSMLCCMFVYFVIYACCTLPCEKHKVICQVWRRFCLYLHSISTGKCLLSIWCQVYLVKCTMISFYIIPKNNLILSIFFSQLFLLQANIDVHSYRRWTLISAMCPVKSPYTKRPCSDCW